MNHLKNRENSDVPAQPLQQKARGRPRKIKIGRKGRAALKYKTVPLREENTDSNQESENLTENDEEEENLNDDEDIQISSLVNKNIVFNVESEWNIN